MLHDSPAPDSAFGHFFDSSFERFFDHYAVLFMMLPPAVQYGFAALFGLLIGSFLSVVVHRLPIMLELAWQQELQALGHGGHPADAEDQAGASATAAARAKPYNLWWPGSACTACGHRLRAWENIPLLGYLALRGRCHACGVRISPRYPLLEIATAALAILSLWCFGPGWQALAGFGCSATLLALGVIDADTQLLPDSLTLPLLWAGLIINLGAGFAPLADAVGGAVAGYLFLWALYWLFKLVRGIEGMGYGDFKLLAAIGAWLGWAALPQVAVLASLAGALAGLLACWRGRLNFDQPLPFGPFLAASGIFTLFFGTPFYHWIGG